MKGYTRTVVQSSPEPSAVNFNNRTTDREPHTHAAGVSGVESIKDSFDIAWINADPTILNRHPALIAFAALGSGRQKPLAVIHGVHCLDAVDDQVNHPLLYLYA